MFFEKAAAASVLLVCTLLTGIGVAADVTRYVRYTHDGLTSYGILEDQQIAMLDDAPYRGGQKTDKMLLQTDVTLLAPVEPSKVFAVGFNFMSHRGDRELPAHPPIFLKLPTTITGPDTEIVYPPGALNVHFEGELVIVIGKTARRISSDEAGDYIFGVTAGNDISARDWQAGDLQWFRGKASDNFGPIGPVLVSGLDYRDLLLQTRLNGEVMQKQRTSDHIHDAHAIVSFISQYVTLFPGDLIFTGTPGATSAMKPGDTVEIELEGVGILRNTIGKAVE